MPKGKIYVRTWSLFVVNLRLEPRRDARTGIHSGLILISEYSPGTTTLTRIAAPTAAADPGVFGESRSALVAGVFGESPRSAKGDAAAGDPPVELGRPLALSSAPSAELDACDERRMLLAVGTSEMGMPYRASGACAWRACGWRICGSGRGVMGDAASWAERRPEVSIATRPLLATRVILRAASLSLSTSRSKRSYLA